LSSTYLFWKKFTQRRPALKQQVVAKVDYKREQLDEERSTIRIHSSDIATTPIISKDTPFSKFLQFCPDIKKKLQDTMLHPFDPLSPTEISQVRTLNDIAQLGIDMPRLPKLCAMNILARILCFV
jgi:hypothetical protein